MNAVPSTSGAGNTSKVKALQKKLSNHCKYMLGSDDSIKYINTAFVDLRDYLTKEDRYKNKKQ